MPQFTYKVQNQLAVTVYDAQSGQEMPFLYQPFSPVDGKFWENEQDADAWAQGYVQSLEEREARIAAEQAAQAAQATQG